MPVLAPLLAAAALVLGIIAAIIKFVGKDTGALQWMLIIGLIAVAGAVLAWILGAGRQWWTARTRTGA